MVVTYFETEAFLGTSFALVLLSIVLTLKMISFTHFNYYLIRASSAELEKHKLSHVTIQPTKAPNTLFHLWYFLIAPTLCYQLEYPRSPKIRKGFLLRRLVEFIFCCLLVVAIIQQYILITVKNTLPYFEELTV